MRVYAGDHPRVEEIQAAPDAVAELQASTTYGATFGPAAPEEAPFVVLLEDAVGWSNIRIALELYLTYAKSQEVVVWKGALTQMDQLRAAYALAVTHDPSVATEFPATARLLSVRAGIAKKAAATRARNAKAKATPATTPATGANAAPAVTPSTVTNGSGGAAH
jgi:hypothetical protein